MTATVAEARPFNGNPHEWDAFVTAQPNSTSSHLFAWKRIVEDVYGHDCPYLAAYEDDAITGVLPLVDVRSLAFGRFMVSMPFLSAGGPIGADRAIPSLVRAAVDLANTRRLGVLELRCTQQLPIDLTHSTEKVSCVLPLPGEPETVWSRLPSKLRSQIRRPMKDGVEMRFGEDQVHPFFTVFARNMRDLGSPTHPSSFFRVIADRFRTNAWFGCAYYRGKPIAGGCALVWKDEVEMTWASSLRDHSALAANMLLYWSFIERASALGLKRFNFGRCTPNTGSHRFKLQWGAADLPLHWYRATLIAGAATPRADEGKLSIATRLWQRVPVPLATFMGGRLRGGIPS